MEKKFKALPPIMPNYIHFEQLSSLKQDGLKSGEGYDIINLSKEEAEEYAEFMRVSFLAHWEKRRNNLLK